MKKAHTTELIYCISPVQKRLSNYDVINILVREQKTCVYSPDIPVGAADFRLITSNYWNSLLCIQYHLPGENAAHFLQLQPFT